MSRTLVLAELVLAALVLGTTFAHVLELPPRIQLDPALWVELTRPDALYRWFGVIGGPLEGALVVVATVVAVRTRRRAFLASALAFAAALATWIMVVAPANAAIGAWTALPADVRWWQLRWEIGHAASFALVLAGYVVLVIGALAPPVIPCDCGSPALAPSSRRSTRDARDELDEPR